MYLMGNLTLGAASTVGQANGFCARTADIWQLVGVILLIFKIVIPIILIVLGMIDLGKAVVSSDEKAIQKSAKTLGLRIVAAVCIFFVPSLISFVFSVISAFNNDVKADFDVCKTCIVHPNKKEGTGTCSYYVGQIDVAN